MKSIFFLIFLLLGYSSCVKNESFTETESVGNLDSFVLDANFNYVHLIPDSLRTPEEQQFLLNFKDFILEHVRIKGDDMVLNITEEEFVAKGFPKEYYILVQKNLRDNNKFFKDNNISIDSIENMDKFKKFDEQ